MRFIQWSASAQGDLQRLQAFLIDANPKAAHEALAAVGRAAERLMTFPSLGRALKTQEGFRELIVPFGRGNYVLRYRLHQIDPSTLGITIVRVWHNRELR